MVANFSVLPMNKLKSKPMKTILIFLIALFNFSFAYASGDPAEPLVIHETSTLEVQVTNSSQTDFFHHSTFNFDSNNLEFETENEITFVQIFDKDGKLSFQLPVMSNKLTIGRSIFGSGDYKLGFIIKGMDEVQFADIKIK